VPVAESVIGLIDALLLLKAIEVDPILVPLGLKIEATNFVQYPQGIEYVELDRLRLTC
jgi:hypothetical protein